MTRNTSLIVLDNLSDYVRHRITPPAELLAEYTRIVEAEESRRFKDQQDNVQRVLNMFESRKNWWKRDFQKEQEERKIAEEKARREREQREKENRERLKKQAENRRSSGGNSMIARQTNTYNGNNVSGVVKDEAGEPLPGVTVLIKGTNTGRITDLDGNYIINDKLNDVLQFKYLGYNPIEVSVRGSQLDIILTEDNQTLDEVVVVGYGTQRKKSMIGAVSKIAAEELSTPAQSVSEALAGRVAGVQVNEIALDRDETALVKETASSDQKVKDQKEAPKPKALSAGIALNKWSPDAAYLSELREKSDKELYTYYIEIKGEYKSTPSFFLDVADLFEKRGMKEKALIILSNLAEMEIENYRLTRVLAHRLKQLGYNEYAIDQFKIVLRLRPEEPQTFRDLGLAYAQNKEYQEAVNTLYKIVERRWDGRFPQVELIAVEELNNVIDKAKREKVKLDLSSVDHRLIFNMPVDVRVVLNWDTDNSDMDLWVTDPVGEKCYYSHKLTRNGGLMSNDFTGGYGPEEFLIKNAIKGKYKIQANYYGTREQTVILPTTIYLDIFTYYASGKEKKETITLRLSNKKETISIGEVTFE